MKSLPLLAIALFVGCAVTDQPTTSSTQSAVSGSIDSESWDPDKNVGSDLWPGGAGITTTNVLYRKGPDICVPNVQGQQCTQAYLAFVVWNHSTVGHVYWIPENAIGADFHNKLDNIYATRTNNSLDHWSGGNGGTGSGTPPVPHPNVDGKLVCSFSSSYQNVVKNTASTIEGADQSFLSYYE